MSTLYSDALVEVSEQDITFRKYDWVFRYRPRRVAFSEIENIAVSSPSLATGKWRLFGTGDFKTWFPLDWRRPSRDKIFIASLRQSHKRIGFTVEDSARVEKILREKGLLKEPCGSGSSN